MKKHRPVRPREWIAWLLVLAHAVFILVYFVQIVVLGSFYIQEPRPVILWLEISLVIAIIGTALFYLLNFHVRR